MRLITIICLFQFFVSQVYAESVPDFKMHEDNLKRLKISVPSALDDNEKLEINQKFKTYFEKVLNKEGSFAYSFDSLQTVSLLRSPDERFRIISWYIPLSNHNFNYFGFLQVMNLSTGKWDLIELFDNQGTVENISHKLLSHDNWLGTFYSEVIHRNYKGNDYYFLLGWRADNPLTRKRIIEPLIIDNEGVPTFGKQVFQYKDNLHTRIIFEYSSRVNLIVRYDTFRFPGSRAAEQVIIFDRLAPTHEFLKGNYQFYVPEMNIFDAFRFTEGQWVFIEDIDIRNPRHRPPPRPTPPNLN